MTECPVADQLCLEHCQSFLVTVFKPRISEGNAATAAAAAVIVNDDAHARAVLRTECVIAAASAMTFCLDVHPP